MLKTSPHHKTCEMINAYWEIKPITGLLLKNYSVPTHAFFPSLQTQFKHIRRTKKKKINSQGQREPEKATMETYYTKHC